MSFALLSDEHRIALAALVLVGAAIAGLLVWRRAPPWPAIACLAAALLAGAALGIDRAVALLAEGATPADQPFDEHELTRTSPWGPVGLGAGAAATLAIVALGVVSTRGIASPWGRSALIALRTGAALAALVLFVEPAIELRDVAREPNHIAVIVDDSLSMSLREDEDGPTRFERARELLGASEATFSAWREDREIDAFRFSDDLERAALETVTAGDPEGRSTRFRRALEGLRDAYEDRDLAGAVLISDGIPTGAYRDGAERGRARQLLRSLGAPIHTFWVGRPGLKDVAIADVRVDELAFVRTVVPIEVVVRSTGYDEPRRIPLTLSEEGEPVRRKWIDLDAGDTEKRVRFEYSPPRTGTFAYEVSTPVADDEAIEVNNSRSFVLRVIRDQIRVLQVAGQPSWDVRGLRSMLKDNPNVDLISFFILRTQDDVTRVPDDELSLIPFPTRELFEDELPSFDVVVLQNFNFAPYRLGRYLENIRRYVEGGGALVMLGGELSFSSGDYHGTPVGEALPVELSPSRSEDSLLHEGGFSPALTRAGASHPVTALRHDPADNRAAWTELPELRGVNRVVGARPDAAVLAVHPNVRTDDGERMPVIVAGEHGDGRTLAITTDSLWRWDFAAAGQSGIEPRYHEFWQNAIRWMIRDPAFEHLQVAADRREYEPGASAEVETVLRDRDYEPVDGAVVELHVERQGHDHARETLLETELTTGEEGTAAHALRDLEPGLYRVEARAQAAGDRQTAPERFVVGRAPRELERPAAESELLAEIARQTGGEHFAEADSIPPDLAFEEPRVVRVDRRTEVELWSRPVLLVLALLLLTLEWGLRQKLGTL